MLFRFCCGLNCKFTAVGATTGLNNCFMPILPARYVNSVASTTSVSSKSPIISLNKVSRTANVSIRPSVIDSPVEEFVSQARYPPVRSKYPPPGPEAWGSMDPVEAWYFHERDLRYRECPSLWKKLWQWNLWEHRHGFYQLQLPHMQPESLDFVRYITRTEFQSGEPSAFAKTDVPAPLLESVVRLVEDSIRLEYGSLVQHVPENPSARAQEALAPREIIGKQSHFSGDSLLPDTRYVPTLQTTSRAERSARPRVRFLSSLLDDILSLLRREKTGGSFHDATQIDEGGAIETFWRRSGYERVEEVNVQKLVGMTEYLKYVNTKKKDPFGHVHFQIRGRTHWALRSRQPLPEFLPFKDALKFDREFFRFGEDPIAWQQLRTSQVDLHQFDIMPFDYRYKAPPQDKPVYGRNIPGFWTRTFFWDGDPCEYMHTALLYVPPAQLTAAVGEVSSLAPPDVQARIAVQNAVLAAFANTSALAFIHGFTYYNPLSYAFPMHVIVTDGERIALCAYQLNSLTGLWKPVDAKEPINLLWCLGSSKEDASASSSSSPPIAFEPLFERVDPATGRVVGLNTRLVRDLVRVLLQQPLTEAEVGKRGLQLQPFLKPGVDTFNPEATPTRLVGQLIDYKPEPVRPAAADEELDDADNKAAPAVVRKRLVRSIAPRIMGEWHNRKHPNEVYRWNLVDPLDVAEDVRDTFGGKIDIPRVVSKHYARKMWLWGERYPSPPADKAPVLRLPGIKNDPKPRRSDR